ncbi:MAG TPA: sialate O-acetylesterase [Opitutaceae bacterium]|nr:sialate O-acetylesterase [Opitutaceae bacterium]
MSPFPRLLFLLSFAAGNVHADVVPAALFSDRAVLQREKPVPIWGRAEAGEKITVTFGGQKRATTTGSDGRWIVFLDALPASAQGTDLTIAGKNTVVLRDIVVGEVWLCSGQSNMEWPVSRAMDAPRETATANFPLLRHVRVEHVVAESPADMAKTGGGLDKLTAGWQSTTPQTVGGFTAVGYYFARDLHLKLGVPIGLVHSSWGGTPVESWLSPAALDANPAFAIVRERWRQALVEYPTAKPAYEAWLAEWTRAEAAAKKKTPPAQRDWLQKNPRRRAPRGPGDPWTPTGLFNGMIHPLLPYALRGAIWYQGESNAERASEYHALFTALIAAWRTHFGQGDFPFFWVSLANYKVPEDPTGQSYAFLREAQTKALALPNTGQALAIDLGDPDNIHPTNKQAVGRRLALLARNRVYDVIGDDTGPTFTTATREGAGLRVRFTHADGGLIAHEKPVQSLELAGADRVFRPAEGRIDRETLFVTSPLVRQPVAVRYAWKNAPDANLYNGAGLPAVPFRSDDW